MTRISSEILCSVVGPNTDDLHFDTKGKNSHEAVHRSAVERSRKAGKPGYAPNNLVEYLKGGGPVVPADDGGAQP